MNSKSFKLNKADVISLVKNAVLVGGASALTYVANNLGHLDLGATGMLVVPIISVGLDSLIKWMKDNTKKEG